MNFYEFIATTMTERERIELNWSEKQVNLCAFVYMKKTETRVKWVAVLTSDSGTHRGMESDLCTLFLLLYSAILRKKYKANLAEIRTKRINSNYNERCRPCFLFVWTVYIICYRSRRRWRWVRGFLYFSFAKYDFLFYICLTE